jgi:hypothetical protein
MKKAVLKMALSFAIESQITSRFSALSSLRQEIWIVRRGDKVLASCNSEKHMLQTIFALAVASLIFSVQLPT